MARTWPPLWRRAHRSCGGMLAFTLASASFLFSHSSSPCGLLLSCASIGGKTYLLCFLLTLAAELLNFSSPNAWQFLHTKQNSFQPSPCVPGDRIRSHRLRAPSLPQDHPHFRSQFKSQVATCASEVPITPSSGLINMLAGAAHGIRRNIYLHSPVYYKA